MKIKNVITCGCSFADKDTDFAWPRVFERKLKNTHPDIEFNHVGMGSQGNELIQKKTSLAIVESLEKYKPEEIAVIVMWTGTERKAFYVDNKEFVKNVSDGWNEGSVWWGTQFADLKNQLQNREEAIHPETKSITQYNKNGGWYICNFLFPDSILTKEYFNSFSTLVAPATISLENIIMLQNLCEVKKINFYQTFYRDYVYTDILENKNHLNLNYLYKQWNYDTILSTTGIYEHLRPDNKMNNWDMGSIFKKIFQNVPPSVEDETSKYFTGDRWHPNELGSTKWIDEVLVPKLTERGFFND